MENDENKYIGKFLEKDYDTFKGGLLELLNDYKRKSQRLDKIIKQSDKTQLKLLQANEKLHNYKTKLEKKVQEEILRREKNEKLLLEQSKHAAMGEMIDAIAHQWSQPLGILSMHNQVLGYDFLDGKVDQEYINNYQEKNASIIEHMNTTLNEFRAFFKTNKTIKRFSVEKMLENINSFLKDEFIKEKITISISIIDEFSIAGIENEFKHIILNILNNSKDAFNINHIKNKQIHIKVYKEDIFKIIEINDNAGGIPENIITKIFKSDFTTKKEKGSGMGLYLSSLIAEKNNTTLNVKNIKDGVSFILRKKSLD